MKDEIMSDVANERRGDSAGRRESDFHKCVFHHDFEKTVNSDKAHVLNCLVAVKDRIKLLEIKIGGTVSVKVAAIITTVAMGFLIAFISTCFAIIPSVWDGFKNDLRDMNTLIIGLEHRIDALQNEQIKIATKQDGMINSIDFMKRQERSKAPEN